MYNIKLLHTAGLTSHSDLLQLRLLPVSLCEKLWFSPSEVYTEFQADKVAMVEVSIELLRFFHVNIILAVLRTMDSGHISDCSSIHHSRNETNFHNKKNSC